MSPTPTRPVASGRTPGMVVARYVSLFRDTRIWLALVALLFLAGLVAGVFGAMLRPDQHALFLRDMIERLRPALDALHSGDNSRAIGMILWNNLRIALLIMGTGALVVFLFLPIVAIGANGYLLGSVAMMSGHALDRLVLSIVPHGIFEVPALIIAGAWGLKNGPPLASARCRRPAWRGLASDPCRRALDRAARDSAPGGRGFHRSPRHDRARAQCARRLACRQNGRPDARPNYCKYGKIAYWLHSRDNESYADEWKAFRLCR